jgi:hypothetical protein
VVDFNTLLVHFYWNLYILAIGSLFLQLARWTYTQDYLSIFIGISIFLQLARWTYTQDHLSIFIGISIFLQLARYSCSWLVGLAPRITSTSMVL